MENNWDLIEKNEAGAKAMGGTELFMRFLYNGNIPRNLLEQTQLIPGRVRTVEKNKIRILTLHDLPQDPECSRLHDSNFRSLFHKLVFISNWQYQQFKTVLGLPFSLQSTVIENGLEPISVDFGAKPLPDEVINIAYITTPHRGLSLLVPVFEELAKSDKKIHLHVHSSFKIYGWDSADKQFEDIFKKCEDHIQITYHGFTEFYELRKLMANYHICAYPSIWEETACRSVLEAMSAGMVCVHPNFGALPDTSGGLNFMYDGTTTLTDHKTQFTKSLLEAIDFVRNNGDNYKTSIRFNKQYVDTRYAPEKAYDKWTKLLTELTERFPDESSRGVKEERFVYRTA